MTGGKVDAFSLNWPALCFQHAAVIRDRLVSSSLARFVDLSIEGLDIVFSDNYRDVLAGYKVTITYPLPHSKTQAEIGKLMKLHHSGLFTRKDGLWLYCRSSLKQLGLILARHAHCETNLTGLFIRPILGIGRIYFYCFLVGDKFLSKPAGRFLIYPFDNIQLCLLSKLPLHW